MAYARFSDGDVYVWMGGDPDGHDVLYCQVCSLLPKDVKTIFTEGGEDIPLFGDVPACGNCKGDGCDECCFHQDYLAYTYADMIAHLGDHIAAGHKVPDYAIQRLREEQEVCGGDFRDPDFDFGKASRAYRDELRAYLDSVLDDFDGEIISADQDFGG